MSKRPKPTRPINDTFAIHQTKKALTILKCLHSSQMMLLGVVICMLEVPRTGPVSICGLQLQISSRGPILFYRNMIGTYLGVLSLFGAE